MTCSDRCPLSQTGTFNCLSLLGGGTEREVNGEDCQEEGDSKGGGKGEGQGSVGPRW